MDISSLFYRSIPINWKSSTRETSPAYYESKGIEWLRTFYGGFPVMCGLTNTGPPNRDDDEAKECPSSKAETINIYL